MWADGKVYFATEDGEVWIFAHGRGKKLLAKVEMDYTIRVSPVFANGTLYVTTESTLYAIRGVK